MGTRRYLAVLVDIYAATEVDGLNGVPKGSEAATWKPKTAGCKNRNRHFVILVKMNLVHLQNIIFIWNRNGAKH